MKILIMSDTHRRDDNMEHVIEMEKPFDMLIHLGDIEGSELKLPLLLDKDCALHMVLGNNDFFSDLDTEKEIGIGKYRALLTHGHPYSVSLGTERLRREVMARGLNMAMFGHTHRPYYENKNGIIILSPGSLSYPRQEGRQASYMIMQVDENGEVSVEQKYIENEC